jgi:hypothetical protein
MGAIELSLLAVRVFLFYNLQSSMTCDSFLQALAISIENVARIIRFITSIQCFIQYLEYSS